MFTNDGGVNIITPDYGDTDQNGLVQAYDAAMILKYLVGTETFNEAQIRNADVTLDNTASSLDASVILQYNVGSIDELPYAEPMLASGNLSMENHQVEPGQIIEVPFHL